MILISNDFWRKIKLYNFYPYNALLSIATNIPVLLMTAFVLQGHLFINLNTSTKRALGILNVLCS